MALCAASNSLSTAVASEPAPLGGEGYPALSAKQLGHVRHLANRTSAKEADVQPSFPVYGLDPMKDYRLSKDGKILGRINRSEATTVPGATWQPDHSLEIETALDVPHAFVLEALPSVAARHQ